MATSTSYLFRRLQPFLIGMVAWTALAAIGWMAFSHDLGKMEGVVGVAMGALLMLGMSAFKTQLSMSAQSRSSLLHDLVNGKQAP